MNDDSLVNPKAVSVLFYPLTITSRCDLSGWRCWSAFLVSLLASAGGKWALSVSSQGLGTLSSAPGHGEGTAELPLGAFVPRSRNADGSSRICHVGRSLELPKDRAWPRAVIVGGDPARVHRYLHKADGFEKVTQKVGCSLNSRQDLRIP